MVKSPKAISVCIIKFLNLRTYKHEKTVIYTANQEINYDK